MAEIEFLEPAAPPAGVDAAPARAAQVRTAPSLRVGLAGVLALAAALLSAIAATSRLYSIGFGTPGDSSTHLTVDAAGSYGRGPAYALQSGPDYALVMWLAAGVFALVAVALALTAVGRQHRLVRPATLAVGLVSGGVLAGLTVAAWMDADSTIRSVRATIRSAAANGDPVNAAVSSSIGPAVVLAAAAVGAVAVALLLTATAPTRRHVVDVQLPPYHPATHGNADAPAHEDDEELRA